MIDKDLLPEKICLEDYGGNYKAYICYAIAKSDFKDYEDAVELYKKAIEIFFNFII